MNPLTIEWIEKAEGDLNTAQRELRARKFPNFDSACFHAQQLAEKYLKAFLQEKQMDIPRTHHLIDLVALIIPANPMVAILQDDLKGLEGYAVQFRYPGQNATKEDAHEAINMALNVRAFMRGQLGIE